MPSSTPSSTAKPNSSAKLSAKWSAISSSPPTSTPPSSVHTLDKGYNLRKLERYLSIVLDSGIQPVILLTKKDLLSDEQLRERLEEVSTRIPNVPALAISNVTGDGLDDVHELLEPAKTYCLIGASGVGKTSLINSIIGEEDYYFTLPVREKDGKGIHSTTWRELIELDTGALMIGHPRHARTRPPRLVNRHRRNLRRNHRARRSVPVPRLRYTSTPKAAPSKPP